MANRRLIYSPSLKENYDVGYKNSANKHCSKSKQNNVIIRTSLELQKTPKTMKTQNVSDSAVTTHKYR